MNAKTINFDHQIGQHLPEFGPSQSDRDNKIQKGRYKRPILTFNELPVVIWTSVIQHSITVFETTDGDPSYSYGYLSVDLLLPLLLVSRGWERRILETPTLWTTILIDDDLQDAHVKIACCLQFSKQAVLCLHFGKLFVQSWMAISRSIIPNSSRIQTIQAVGYSSGHALLDIIDEISPLPALISIMGNLRDIEDASFEKCVKDLQSLKMLHGLWTPISVLKDHPQEWEQIQIVGDLAVAVSLLSSIPSIRDVILETDGPLKVTNPEFIPNFVLGSLPWTSLDYYDEHNVYDLGILQSLVHTLSTFTLTGTVNLICQTVLYLPEMLQLHTLVIYARPGERCNSTIASMTCGVHDLTVDASDLPREQFENLKILFKIFPAATPLIRRLHMDWVKIDGSEDYTWFLRNQEFKHLETINFIWRPTQGSIAAVKTKQQPLLLPVSVLWVNIASYDPQFPEMVSDKAENLVLSTLGTRWSMSPSILHSWVSLRSLTLPYTERSFNGFSLPYLQKLILNVNIGADYRNITGFCQQLALSPQNCPSLEHIEFQQCPEWDILLLMLERRNSIQDMGISRIRRIVLPAAYLSCRIRNLLIVVMQGRGSAPISNSELYQLSLAGSVDVLYDPSIPGCVVCHQAPHSCKYPWESRSYRPPLVTRQSQYPISSAEVLLTWEKRYQGWHSIRHGRSFSCTRINDVKKVCVDDYSEQELLPEWGSDDEM